MTYAILVCRFIHFLVRCAAKSLKADQVACHAWLMLLRAADGNGQCHHPLHVEMRDEVHVTLCCEVGGG